MTPPLSNLTPLSRRAAVVALTVGGSEWNGGVLAGNGLIYAIPYESSAVLIIDPEAMTADTSSIAGVGEQYGWIGGALAANGKVVGIPYSSDAVLVVDPATNTADTTTLTATSTGIGKYRGGVLAPNGLVYAIPRNAESVLVIDVGC